MNVVDVNGNTLNDGDTVKLTKDLKVMDATAISLARENNIPIVVFNVREKGNFAKVVASEGDFTIVSN